MTVQQDQWEKNRLEFACQIAGGASPAFREINHV